MAIWKLNPKLDQHVLFDKLKGRIPKELKLGKTFVEDNREVPFEEWEQSVNHDWNMITYADEYENWYLPFKRCSWLAIDKDPNVDFIQLKTVTFRDNPEHKLTSMINFEIFVGTSTRDLITGILELIPRDNFDQDALNKKAAELGFELVLIDKDSIDSHYAVSYYRNMIIVENGKRNSIKLTKRYSHNPGFVDALNTMQELVMRAFVYFTKLVINTRLFVVEQTKASKNKKGKIISTKRSTLYRIIDIRDLRKNYIRNVSDDNSSTESLEVGFERRRHERTYRHERYKKMRGKTVIIEPTWIGPVEAFEPNDPNRPNGGKLYKVRLDIG